MKCKSCCWLSVCISPHLDAIVKSLSQKIKDFLFLFQSDDLGRMRISVGWETVAAYNAKQYQEVDNRLCLEPNIYIDNLRQIDISEERVRRGKLSVYMGERWFKPPIGFLRILVPSYQKMAKRFLTVFASGKLILFPSGIHVVRGMLRLGQFLGGALALFKAPKVAFESRSGERIYDLEKAWRLGLITREEYKMGEEVGFVQISSKRF